MSKGFFTNKAVKPSDDELAQVLGGAKAHWDGICHHLQAGLKLKGEFKFYGVNYGWALRFTKSGKSVIALYPAKESFVVQVILNRNQEEVALQSGIDATTAGIISRTESICEGKWIYLTVDNQTDLRNIETLVAVRIRVK